MTAHRFIFNPFFVVGYTAKDVKGLLARVGAGQGSRLKRVVMLSSVGVNRRDDLMLKFRQMHVNLDARVGLTYFVYGWRSLLPV